MYALLVTDDTDDQAIYSLILQRAGLAVTTTKSLDHALDNWSERPADIILLSLTGSPQEHIRRVRSETLTPLILVVSPLDTTLHAELLKQGADLVVPPVFDAKLFIAQIGVLMRRSGSVPTTSLPTLSATNLILDPTTRIIERSDRSPQRLTHLEFRLLYTLIINRNQVVPTETLVERVWGYNGQGDRDLVRGLISRLRVKVETDPRNPEYILTMPGIGYMFSDQPA